MTVPGNLSSPLLATAAEAAAAADVATKSLRFNNADSANLSRTFSSAGNRKTWTWAGWVKRSTLGTGKYGLFGGSGTNSMIRFNNDDGGDGLRVLDGATGGYDLITDRKFRDTSAWYHIAVAIDTTQSTAADRVKIYVNGVQEDTFYSSSYPTQNAELTFNNNISHTVGTAIGSIAFDGYLADVYFIDGLAISPVDNFIELDDNGVYQAKAYSGTFGTNGFHLDFSDATSTTTIAEDSSGNDNDFTANNISVTAGSGNDSMFDAPTNGSQSDTGAGGEVSGNYATLNSIATVGRDCTFSNGNLDVVVGTGFNSTSNDGIRAVSTIGMTSGKWYFEHEITGGSVARSNVGVVNNITTYGFGGNHWIGSGVGDYIVWSFNGQAYNNGSGSSYGDSWTTGDIIGCAFDADNGNLYVYKNGTVMNSGTAAFTGLTSGPYFFICTERESNITANFGQRAFEYTAPTGYKALCTTNLATPAIADGSDYVDAKLYTGNGTGQTITGLGFSPDLTFIKQRNQTRFITVFDTVRGANKRIMTNRTDAETTQTDHLSAFTSDGFTVQTSANVNYNTGAYITWAWDAGSSTVSNTDGSITSSVRANQSAGFSIVSYTGTGSAATVGHGLNADMGMVITKTRESTNGWIVWHKSFSSSTNNYLQLNLTDAVGTLSNYWGSGGVTSSVIGLGTYTGNNTSNEDMIAYCFAPVAGYSAFSSFEGTGAADNFVYTGFRSRLVWIKEVDNANPWYVYDTARNTYNTIDNILQLNAGSSESTIGAGDGSSQNGLQIFSNGFAIPHTLSGTNRSGSTYIFCAWAENPFQANGGLAR